MKICVFKEDQKSQIFLQLTVLLCNIARKWYISRIFNIKSSLFSLEKAWPWNIIFLEEISLMQEKEMISSYWWLTSGNIIKWCYLKTIISKYICTVVISSFHYLNSTWNFSNIVSKKLHNYQKWIMIHTNDNTLRQHKHSLTFF